MEPHRGLSKSRARIERRLLLVLSIIVMKPSSSSLEATTVHQVEAAAPLYDGPPVRTATIAFLADLRHHLLVAVDDGQTVGFISGVEMTHPDKRTEMFLYELAVAEDARQRGIGLALTARLVELARTQGCYGMC